MKWFYRGIEAPMGLVLVGALLALCLSSYPIIFFGKSYVSPGYGPQMIYDQLPYVPGYLSTDKENLSADAGAMPWQNLPYSRVQHEAVFEHGEFPLWNRYNSAGLPLFGQGQSQFLDPLHWIAVAGEGNSWAWDLKFLLSKLVFLAGIGACVLLMTGNKVATIAVTISAAFIGFFYFRFNHPVFFNLTYAPWVFYFYLQLVRTIELGQRRWSHKWPALPLVGIFVASVLHLFAGTPKEGIILFGGLHFAGLTGVIVVSRGLKALLSNIGVLIMLWISIALATAPHWLIFLDTLSKVSTVYNTPNCNFASRPWQFVDTFFLGPKDLPWSEPNINTFIWVSGFAAFFAVSRWVRKPLFWMITFPLLGLLAFAYGVVPNSICQRIPFVGVIHHIHHTFFTSAVVFAVLLAGLGLASVLSDVVHNKNRVMWTAYSVITGALLAWWAYPHYDSYEYATSVAGMLSVLSIAGVTVMFLSGIWLSGWKSGYSTSTIALLLLIFVLVHFYHGLHLNTKYEELDNLLINPTPRADLLQASPAVSLLHLDSTEPNSVFKSHLYIGLNNRSGLITQVMEFARQSGGSEKDIVQFEGDLRRAIIESNDALTANAHVYNYLRGVGAKVDSLDGIIVVDDLLNEKKQDQFGEQLAKISRDPHRVIGEGRTPMSGFYAFLHLESLNGPDALMSDRYMVLLDALGWLRPPREAWLRTMKSEDITRLQPLLDLLNVGYFLSFRKDLNVFHLVSNVAQFGQFGELGSNVSSLATLSLKHHPDISTDRVSCASNGLQPDGKPDNVFSLKLDKLDSSRSISLIHAMRLERGHPNGVNHTGDNNYVLGVSEELTSPLLNDKHGKIRIPIISKTMQLWLFGCADGFDEFGTEYVARIAVDRNPPIRLVYQKDLNVWARESTWPRAFFVDSVATYTDVEDFADFVRQADGLPLAAVEGKWLVVPEETRTVVPAVDYKLTNNSTSFRLNAPNPGIVVLTEVNIPGDVHVTVNNESGQVLTVNHAFRGVKIPKAGDFEITFTYRPELWNIALVLSGCGLLILVMMVIIFSRNKRLPPALAT